MATIGNLKIRLTAITTQFNSALNETRRRLASLRKNVRLTQMAFKALKATVNVVASAIKTAFAAGTLGGGFLVKLAADAEQTAIAFRVLVGDAEKAKKTLKDLRGFAAATPFSTNEVLKSGRGLLAFGVAPEDLVTTLRQIGDVAAGINQPLNEMASIFGKARVQGRLFAEDMNQLSDRGVPIFAEIARQFGVAEGEVRKLVTDGKVGFENLEVAFINMSQQGGRFANLMKEQSASLKGLFSTLLSELTRLGELIGKQVIERFNLKERIQAAIDFLKNNRDFVLKFTNALVDGVAKFAEFLFNAFKAIFEWVRKTVSELIKVLNVIAAKLRELAKMAGGGSIVKAFPRNRPDGPDAFRGPNFAGGNPGFDEARRLMKEAAAAIKQTVKDTESAKKRDPRTAPGFFADKPSKRQRSAVPNAVIAFFENLPGVPKSGNAPRQVGTVEAANQLIKAMLGAPGDKLQERQLRALQRIEENTRQPLGAEVQEVIVWP